MKKKIQEIKNKLKNQKNNQDKSKIKKNKKERFYRNVPMNRFIIYCMVYN